MTKDRTQFSQYEQFSELENDKLGDSRVVKAFGVGTVLVRMFFSCSDHKPGRLYNVLHVPDLATNLFSVWAMTARGNTVKFGKEKCWIKNAHGRLTALGMLFESCIS